MEWARESPRLGADPLEVLLLILRPFFLGDRCEVGVVPGLLQDVVLALEFICS